jgi:hypothetical protein
MTQLRNSAKLIEQAGFLECGGYQKAAAGPSTAPFAKNANGSAQEDRVIMGKRM